MRVRETNSRRPEILLRSMASMACSSLAKRCELVIVGTAVNRQRALLADVVDPGGEVHVSRMVTVFSVTWICVFSLSQARARSSEEYLRNTYSQVATILSWAVSGASALRSRSLPLFVPACRAWRCPGKLNRQRFRRARMRLPTPDDLGAAASSMRSPTPMTLRMSVVTLEMAALSRLKVFTE